MKLKNIFLLGYGLTLWNVTSYGAFLPVCERTEPVKQFLATELAKTCENITENDLLTVTRVDVSERQIQQFKADDFTGLKNLEILNIRSNPYTELPEGLFTDLVNLKTLVIISTKLRHYPDDFLAFAPNIQNIHVFRNPVKSISESVFRRLEEAKNLAFIDLDMSLNAAEQERLRKLFPVGGKIETDWH